MSDVLALLAPFLPNVDVTFPVRDAKDLAVVAAAFAGEAEAIVSGDGDLLEDGELRRLLTARGIRMLTPQALLVLLDR